MTLGILIGYLAGKPVAIVGVAALVTRLSGGGLRPPVGWAAVAGGGAVAGIGFTVSLLIADLAFTGPRLEEAKVGVLSAALCASLATWLVFRADRAAAEAAADPGAARHRRDDRRPRRRRSTPSATTCAAPSRRP